MRLFHVDAFTRELFKGNPAGVCLIDNENLADDVMQLIAIELKHSETAFVDLNKRPFGLRWFTPKKEVDLCGHATLASAFVLWLSGTVSETEQIFFETRSGILTARNIGDRIELDFPQIEILESANNEEVNQALGIQPIFTGKGKTRYLLEVQTKEQLANLKPDFEKLSKCELGAFMVTCKSADSKYDFYSRFFAPYVGIPEDPVTGSAHCYLGPYWSRKTNKKKLIGFQISERTGEIECELVENQRIKLRGRARLFYETKLSLGDKESA